MQQQQVGYVLLFALALFLVASGAQGLLGIEVAVIFAPQYVTIQGGS